MVRTQIQLTEEQSKALRFLATEENVSMAELIRRSIDQLLQQRQQPSRQQLKQRALSVVGKYASGDNDVSTQHDQYLADIYAGNAQ